MRPSLQISDHFVNRGFMRFTATYRIRCAPGEIERKAEALALEQSVEMPREIISDAFVREEIVGQVLAIRERGDGAFDVVVALAAATVGGEPGQLMNMLFGNSSLHDDVTLADVELPDAMASGFCGPGAGLDGLRVRVGAGSRALTCAAIKPQGLGPEALAGLAYQMALGGIDYIKDDHGLADQSYSPYGARAAACAAAVRRAAAETGLGTRYVPSLSGDLDRLRRQVAIARDEGLDTLLIAPMVVGLPAFHALARENRDMAFLAHPAMAGAARIAPPLLFGKLFRLFGADGVIFPNHGGRFGYSAATCAAIAETARAPFAGHASATPVPAGGMTLDRLDELLTFYGPEMMLLIGGSLLAAGDRLAEESARFARHVARFSKDAET
jgi:ribulose-bisphosphate carboxylase large chain